MDIKITNIQITPITPRKGLIAFASVVLNDSIYLGSIGIYTRLDGSGGYRITYPTKKIGDKSFNIYRPTNEEMSKLVEEAVVNRAKELFQGVQHS